MNASLQPDTRGLRDDDAFSYIASLIKRVPRQFWFSLAGTLVFGLAAHMYVFTNTALVHDSVLYIHFDRIDIDISTGRIGDTIIRFFRDFMSVPWLSGLISLFFFSLSSYITCVTLKIKRPVVVVIVSALMVTFPSVSMGNCYIFSIDVFAIYIFLSCLSVYIANKSKWGFVFGSVILLAGLMVYQTAFCVATCLCLAVLIMSLLSQAESIKHAFFRALRFVIMLMAGTLAYYAIWMISVKAFGVALLDYQNMSQVGQYSSIKNTLTHMIVACKNSVSFFLKPYKFSYYPIYVYATTLIALFVTFFRAFILLGEIKPLREKLCRAVLIVVLCALLCLSMDAMHVLSNGARTHFIQRYAYLTPWLLMLAVGEVSSRIHAPKRRALRLAASFAVLICCACSIYNGVYGANVSYMNMQVKYDSAISTATRIIDKIENTEGFTYETPVYIVGFASGEKSHEGFAWCEDSPATGHTSAFTFNENMRRFIRNICPDIDALPGNEYSELPEVKAMPAFPEDGFIKWFDDELVVKFQ